MKWLFSFQIFYKICVACGSLSARESRLCSICEFELIQKINFKSFVYKNIKIQTLFFWEEQDCYSKYVQSIKGSQTRAAWDFWAEIFFKYQGRRFETKKIKFISAPKRIGLYYNLSHNLRNLFSLDSALHEGFHSDLFANKMAQLWGGRFLGSPIEKGDGKRSPFLSRKQRFQSGRFVKKTEWTNSKSDPFVFCDDVRTSGATCFAIYESLGEPSNFEHWTLFFKVPDIDSGSDLCYSQSSKKVK